MSLRQAQFDEALEKNKKENADANALQHAMKKIAKAKGWGTVMSHIMFFRAACATAAAPVLANAGQVQCFRVGQPRLVVGQFFIWLAKFCWPIAC